MIEASGGRIEWSSWSVDMVPIRGRRGRERVIVPEMVEGKNGKRVLLTP